MKRLIVLVVIIVALIGVLFFVRSQGFLEDINPEALYETRDLIKEVIQGRILLAAVVFVIIYFVTVSLTIPGASYLSLIGGFLFGPILGTFLINLGASSGAIIIFLAARYFLGSRIQKKYEQKLEKFNKEIEANGSSYLLTLRFIPIFPFFLINLLSGFTTVKLSTFAWTTIFGIMPGSFVYAWIGYAGNSLEAGKSLLTPEIIVALVLLAIISLVPVVYRKIKGKKSEVQSDNTEDVIP